MENRWNSTEWFSQDTPRSRFSTRSKHHCRIWVANQNNSKEESCSCRCATTSHEEKSKAHEYAWLMPSSWLLLKRSGHFQTWKRMGQNPRSSWSLPSAFVAISYSVRPVHWTEDIWKEKDVEQNPHIPTEIMTISATSFQSVSSIYGAIADMCGEFVTPLTSTRKPCAIVEQSESMVTSDDLLKIEWPPQLIKSCRCKIHEKRFLRA